jgi:1-phosphatidylinositol-4-phosphate 5-kinase
VTENDWVSSDKNEERVVRFVDYAPQAFQRLRQRTCVTEDDYIKSLSPEQILNSFWTNDFQSLLELSSSGQSGALFYFTQDKKYMMKTIARREFKILHRMLPQYFKFRMKNPYSMIVQFYGMFKLEHGSDNKKLTNKIYVVVMENLFKNFQIGVRFDLKGSVTGRSTLKKGQDMNSTFD